MHWKKIVTAFITVGAAASYGAAGHAEGLSLATGFDYTSGKYTGTENTDILYVPFIAKYETGPWTFRATVPYLRITGPGNVIGAGADRVTVPGASTARR